MISFLKKCIEAIVVVSAFLGIIAFGFAVYTEYYKAKSEITLEQVASVNAFEINQASQKLKIFLNGQYIDPQKMSITWEKIAVINTGNNNVTQNLFDKDGRWGIEVSGGDILDVSPIKSNDAYLAQKVRARINRNQIIFPDVIFDKDKSFTFELVIKHPVKETPRFKFFGKIAGVEYKYKDDRNDRNQESFFLKTFSGAVLIQIIRLFSYTLLLIAVILTLTLLGFIFNQTIMLIKRPLRARDFDRRIVSRDRHVSIKTIHALRSLYVEKGKKGMGALHDSLTGSVGQAVIRSHILREFNPKSDQPLSVSYEGPISHVINFEFLVENTEEIKVLYDENLIKLSNQSITVEPKLIEILAEFSN